MTKKKNKKTPTPLSPDPLAGSPGGVSPLDLQSPLGSPSASSASGPGDLNVTDPSSEASSSPPSASPAAGTAGVSHESAVGASAEAASASSTSVTDSLQPLSEDGLVNGGDDRTPPPHLAENSDDSSIESLHVSRRSGGAVRFSMTDLVSQISLMSAADCAFLRAALSGESSPPPASVHDVGGGSLAPPARADGGVACADVSASSSGCGCFCFVFRVFNYP